MAWLECPICYAYFKRRTHNQKYCSDCRKYRQEEIDQYLDERRIRDKLLNKKSIKSIDDVVEDLEAYNKKHGTYLSYGKYVSLMEMGKLKGESDD